MKKQKAVSKFPLTAFFVIQGEGMRMNNTEGSFGGNTISRFAAHFIWKRH